MMRETVPCGVALVAVSAIGCAANAQSSHLMRYADVHKDRIVFTYEGDLWLASADGGDARRITNDAGSEVHAKFSPDGTRLAFTAQYDGGTDIYVMDARGGVPKRLTYHPATDTMVDWLPGGGHVLFRSRREYPHRTEQIYKVSVDGGMPEKLPVDRAGLAAISPDGTRIAYNRIGREHRTWKRHKGGTAQDIWLGSLEKLDYRKVTDWPGTDSFPMWYGDAIYFVSDREYGTLNLYRLDPGSLKVIAITSYKDYDVKYPSIGVDRIVYQYGETLHLLDVKTGASRAVPVEIRSDLVRMRPELVDAKPTTGSFRVSPTGKRVLLEARGDILNLPVEDGEPVNLTRTTGTREKNAAWSPNGQWIAFISDRTGEEEVYLVDQKGELPWRQLTRDGAGFRMPLVWSPDSHYLLFSDKSLRLNLVDTESGNITVVDRGEYDDGWERWGIQDYTWSPDSRWVAYTKLERSMNEAVFLYSLDARKVHRVTGEMTQDWSPSFDPKGRYLYFLSNRTFKPIMGAIDQNHIFLDVCRPYAVILKDTEPSPFAPKDSHEEIADDRAEPEPDRPEGIADEGAKDNDDEDDQAETGDKTRIDVENIHRRIVVADGVPAGNYFRLEATENGFLYLSKPEPEFLKYQNVADHTGGKLELHHYDLDERETRQLLSGIANYHLSADGKKLIYRAGATYGVVEVGKEAKVGDGKVKLDDVRVKVDRNDEFRQIYDEAWRVQRDWFYDPGMHGEDWKAVGDKYRKFISHCGNRSDLNYLIGEMIGELNAGHTYVRGGDIERDAKRVSTGMLGAEFEVVPGADYYRIRRIIPGTPGVPAERSPLDVPGCPIRAGDYLIAIDGDEVRVDDNVYRHLQNKADAVVTVAYHDRPSPQGASTYRVKTVRSERAIRYRRWVEANRAHVEQATRGEVGYVHIPDMMQSGLIELARAYYPQFYRKGIIIDERYNGGGFVADMIIDRLERELWSLIQPREGGYLHAPERAFHGHLIVIVNERTGSSGELFAEAIKRKRIAPILGVRTWGGAVGIELHQPLVDGGRVTPPQFARYGLDGTWLIEGHGVVPDIEVQNLPGDVVAGRDAQLEAAIEYIMNKVVQEPKDIPGSPEFPVKTKAVEAPRSHDAR
ncbi:MAG: PD40 domain-containing protein [Phycisphaerales bacterium]|nr:MAG: PD40 domain-containing protein [Phycisphaerales bacterium]